MEDLEASLEIMFFGDVYEPVASLLAIDLVVTITGRVRQSDDRPTSLMAQSMTIPDVTDPEDRPLVLSVAHSMLSEQLVTQLGDILRSNRGATEVRLAVKQPGRTTLMRLDSSCSVTSGPSLFGDLKALLGPRCLQG